jgi:hypothetical protein
MVDETRRDADDTAPALGDEPQEIDDSMDDTRQPLDDENCTTSSPTVAGIGDTNLDRHQQSDVEHHPMDKSDMSPPITTRSE